MRKDTLARELTGPDLTLTQLRPLRFAAETRGWEREPVVRARFAGLRGRGPYRWWRFLRRLTTKRSFTYEIRANGKAQPLGLCHLKIEPFGDCVHQTLHFAASDNDLQRTARVVSLLAGDLFTREAAWALCTSVDANDTERRQHFAALGFEEEGEVRLAVLPADGSVLAEVPMRLDTERFAQVRNTVEQIAGGVTPAKGGALP